MQDSLPAYQNETDPDTHKRPYQKPVKQAVGHREQQSRGSNKEQPRLNNILQILVMKPFEHKDRAQR